jgi:hypothetical protein
MAAQADAGCGPAIDTAERENNLPARILQAIGIVESGRRDPLDGQRTAWPWSVNAAGDSHLFETREQAIAFVQAAQARGIRSIDIGCMQINLLYHPDAFASLEDGFTPETNVRYATAFLLDLHQRTGDWAAAIGDYHSATPELSGDYARRVQAVMAGEAPGTLPFADTVPAIRTAAVVSASPVILTNAAARRVRVFEPGGVAAATMPQSAARLPRVYYP